MNQSITEKLTGKQHREYDRLSKKANLRHNGGKKILALIARGCPDINADDTDRLMNICGGMS